ncbi:hypothetical protein LPJ62_002587, partial [Coemansia sp. RSA 2167]
MSGYGYGDEGYGESRGYDEGFNQGYNNQGYPPQGEYNQGYPPQGEYNQGYDNSDYNESRGIAEEKSNSVKEFFMDEDGSLN